MATIKTTAKRNPITGDTVNNSSFPGSTGSKREQRKNAAGTLTRRQNNAINQGVGKQNGEIQYTGIPTKGEMRREERRQVRASKKADKPYREMRKEGIYKVADKVDRFLGIGKYDRGSMKKNMDMGGNRSKVKVDKAGQKKQDTECKMKMGKKFGRTGKKTSNPQWTCSPK
jgi:hypothetical protein